MLAARHDDDDDDDDDDIVIRTKNAHKTHVKSQTEKHIIISLSLSLSLSVLSEFSLFLTTLSFYFSLFHAPLSLWAHTLFTLPLSLLPLFVCLRSLSLVFFFALSFFLCLSVCLSVLHTRARAQGRLFYFGSCLL